MENNQAQYTLSETLQILENSHKFEKKVFPSTKCPKKFTGAHYNLPVNFVALEIQRNQ